MNTQGQPQGMPPQGQPPQGQPPHGVPPQAQPPQGVAPQGMPPRSNPPMAPQPQKPSTGGVDFGKLMQEPLTRWLLIAAAVSVISLISTFLPWVSASIFGISVSASGVQGGDGIIALILVLALIALTLVMVFVPSMTKNKAMSIASIVVGGLIPLLALFEMISVSSELEFGAIGVGLYLLLIAGIAAEVFAVFAFMIVLKEGKQAAPAAGPGAFQPPVAQPPHAQPPHAQPPHAQPPHAQPPHAQPPHAQPPHAQPPHAQPPHAQPPHAQPPQA